MWGLHVGTCVQLAPSVLAGAIVGAFVEVLVGAIVGALVGAGVAITLTISQLKNREFALCLCSGVTPEVKVSCEHRSMCSSVISAQYCNLQRGLTKMIGSGDVALSLGKTETGTSPRQTSKNEDPEARRPTRQKTRQKRKETDLQTSSKAVFNFFQLGFWVGALVVHGLGDGAFAKGITPIANTVRESLPE